MTDDTLKRAKRTYRQINKLIEEELFYDDHRLAKHILKNILFNLNYRSTLKKLLPSLPLRTILILEWLHVQFSFIASCRKSVLLHDCAIKL